MLAAREGLREGRREPRAGYVAVSGSRFEVGGMWRESGVETAGGGSRSSVQEEVVSGVQGLLMEPRVREA